MYDEEIKYKAAHFIAPFYMFNPGQKATVNKLYPIIRGASAITYSAGLPAKIHKASEYENLEDGSYLATSHHAPFALDIDNPCRLAGMPF